MSAIRVDHAGGARQPNPVRRLVEILEPGGENERMLRVGVLALGVADVQRAATFWSEALGYKLRDDVFGGWATVLSAPDGSGISIALQRSDTAPQDHPRLHLDLHVANAAEQETEVARLVSLGARHVDWDSYPDDPDFVVLADTEGNLFCMVDLSHGLESS
jgi:predicted enzyme related to lactoylglutathione lyase